MVKKWLMIAALSAVAFTPATASADWLFTPNMGATFGGATNGNEHFTYGASIGWMGAGIFGWEADLNYTPEFFEGNDDDFDFIDGSNVTSAMFNLILGAPVGGQFGPGFRPYVSGGMGLLSREVQSEDDLFDVNSNEWGFNLGAGAMGFATDHVGFRGDLRYIRSFEDLERSAGDFEDTFDAGSFDYWRGTAGITFRW
jgi:opacity protein-like surface antigen